MSLSRFLPAPIAVIVALLGAVLMPASTAFAHGGHGTDLTVSSADEPLVLSHDAGLFDPIAAPFACGTEWSGTTRPGHGQNNWNLDFNRTSLVWPDRQHDMGQPLYAQADGVATYIGWQVNAGTYLDIDYGDYAARYIHLVDDSIPFEVGTTVQQGDVIGLLGDTGNATGFAHLHLEYWDSRNFDDARIWTLKQNGQPQTEVTFDDNVVDPNEVIVSTNCVGAALAGDPAPLAEPLPDPATLPAVGRHLAAIEDGGEAVLLELLLEHTEPLTVHKGDEGDTQIGDGIVTQVPGDDLAGEGVLLVATIDSLADCAEVDPQTACYSATRDGAPLAAMVEALASLDAPRRDVSVAIIDGEHPEEALAALLADPALTDVLSRVVAVVHVGALGESASVTLRNDSLAVVDPETWDWATLAGLTDDPTELQWHTVSIDPFDRPGVNALDLLAVPVVAITDLPGACSSARGTDYGDVDHRKLARQTETLRTVVQTLADADTTPAHAVVDPTTTAVADLTTLAMVREEAGFALDAGFGQIQDFLDAPPDPPTVELVDELLDLATASLSDATADRSCEPFANPAPFDDVSLTSYAVHDVGLLYDLSVTTGTSPTTYRPADPVTRQQMAAFLGRIWRLFHPEVTPTTEMPFVDVDESSYAYDDVRLLFELGVTTGTSPTRYSPADGVTREQMAAFLARTWRALHPSFDESVVEKHPFTDIDPGSFAADDVSLIFHLDITTGTSPTTYAPGERVTRQQMAAFLGRLLRAARPEPLGEVPPVG